MLCALIRSNIVQGVINLTEEEVLHFSNLYEYVIDVSNLVPVPQVGWGFDGRNITNTTTSRKITRLAMRQRFTVSELLGIMNYVVLNPASIVAMLMQNLQVSTYVDLMRSDTQAGLQVLVQYGLITQERALEIINTVPSQIELYIG